MPSRTGNATTQDMAQVDGQTARNWLSAPRDCSTAMAYTTQVISSDRISGITSPA